MASYQIPAIEQFNFSQPEEWPRWIRRFERFRQASGIHTKSEENQVNTLVYSMGEKADDIFRSFHLSEANQKKYETVKQKFEEYFVKRRNVIFERAKFNQRKQEDGESVDDFITDINCLAEHCGYGDLHDEMVRDRIVVGIRDRKLSERMQMDPDLTLEKATNLARQSETVKRQQSTIRGQEDKIVETIRRTREKRNYPQKKWQNKPSKTQSMTCYRCGKSPPHGKGQCPAREAVCHRCGGKGHYQSVCRTKQIGRSVKTVMIESDSETDDTFLGTITVDAAEDSLGVAPWTTTLVLNGSRVNFKIDTGADVTVIPEALYSEDRDGPLTLSPRVLTGASQQPLSVRGLFNGKIKHNHREIEHHVYVVSGLRKPLLGRPAIEALQLVTRIEPIETEEIIKKFPTVFQGLGRLKDDYTIKLKSDAQPFALSTPRRVAIPLLPKVKAELERMEKLGVITKVEEPTEWCAGMVVVPKPNGKVRICVDLTKLNESVCRERHILPSVEQTLAQIGGAKYFSKLDANSGFWQVELAEESSLLTTFITPFGRYRFNRLPFGITSAPEHFQRRMSTILGGLEGVVCLVDDVLVFGETEQEHDERLMAVLTRISESGLTLGREKCVFKANSIKFLGQLVDATGVKADPDKVLAIKGMKPPKNISELRRFLGMVNQLSKFSPNLAEKTKSLRDLLNKKNQWLWGSDQDRAFKDIKELLSSDKVLAMYDPTRETTVSADASSYGLGAVLRQKQPDGSIRPIAYISRALTDTEQRYAQIEKEALAVTWACERFQDYLLGKQFHIETDHKPLVPLLSTKRLEELPIRVQRFRLRLMRYSFTISHIAGKDLIMADTLSRAPVSEVCVKDITLQEEVTAFINLVVRSLPATERRIEDIKFHQNDDSTLSQIKHYCQHGWPNKSSIKGPIKAYLPVQDELSVHNDLLLRGDRLVIPPSLQSEILRKIHSGHQGLTKCFERAKQSVWWPGIRKQLEETINRCAICSQHRTQHAEPLLPTNFPDYPWQKVASDLFQWKNSSYLLVVDYYSRFIEIAKLSTTTSTAVITHLKSIFARHGIPETLVSDNGPQYSAATFSQFARDYGFEHVTSSPKYPQSNGEAERAVKTVKSLLLKNKDPYHALLVYRSTPLANGYSPAELLMGRRLRTLLPTHPKKLQPQLPNKTILEQKEKKLKEKQKQNFDNRHKVSTLKPLKPGEDVWIPDTQSKGTVVKETEPRSYTVQTSEGTYRRNRRHLISLPQTDDTCGNEQSATVNQELTPSNQVSQPIVRTRSGRLSIPPDRL